MSEMNMATQAAECSAYANNPLIAGYEIRLSNNHTTKDPRHKGEVIPLHDICDELQGQYPVTFKFTGWHPHCRCSMIPILISAEERRKLAEAKAAGKSYKPKGVITDVPDNFKQWLADNQERIENAKTLPYFLQDMNDQATMAEQREDFMAYKTNSDYKDVEFDVNSGAYKATHRDHIHHKEEDECQLVLYGLGHSAVLLGEGDKGADGNYLPALDLELDGVKMDIRTITETNENTIRNGLNAKDRQIVRFYNKTGETSDSVCLYFRDSSAYSDERVMAGIESFCAKKERRIKNVYCVVNTDSGGYMKRFRV